MMEKVAETQVGGSIFNTKISFMEDEIKVIVKPEHFRDAPYGYYKTPIYNDALECIGSTPCVLEVALREMFGDKTDEVGASYAFIDNTKYQIPLMWGRTHAVGVEGMITEVQIDVLSEKAKISLEGIPTVEVILTKMLAASL